MFNNFTASVEEAEKYISSRERRPLRAVNYSDRSNKVLEQSSGAVEKLEVVEFHDVEDYEYISKETTHNSNVNTSGQQLDVQNTSNESEQSESDVEIGNDDSYEKRLSEESNNGSIGVYCLFYLFLFHLTVFLCIAISNSFIVFIDYYYRCQCKHIW